MAVVPNRVNRCPIIGILCIDVAQRLLEAYGENVKSYIAASYVKFVENAGAQVVPIWIGKGAAYYEEIMSKINGIIIPGGAVFFNSEHIQSPQQRNDCVESSKIIYQIACRKNNATGNYFPIWGTCLGYELMLYHSAGEVDPRQDCKTMEYSLPVKFEDDFRSSRMFNQLSPEMEEIMEKENFGHHYHRYCITKNDLIQFKIFDQWKVLATNKDSNGLEFISIVEHIEYPLYGCQFHPEKVTFEQYHEDMDKFSHSVKSMAAAEYLAKFFVSECRKNSNQFPTVDEELRHLIWNFPITFTVRQRVGWMQCYLFDDECAYPAGGE